MSSAQYVRGQVVLANFPYCERPHQRGPSEHFCLFVQEVEVNGLSFISVCYGTSQLDDSLIASHNGAILSVPQSFTKISKGKMNSPVTHFLCDYVAIMPRSWVNESYLGRLDYIRPESHQHDAVRQRLYMTFKRSEPIMALAAFQAAEHMKLTGLPGLPAGKKLRK